MGITTHTPRQNRTCPIKGYGSSLHIKKFFCLSLSLSLFFTSSLTSHASNETNPAFQESSTNLNSHSNSLDSLTSQFEKMSNEELNQYIDNVKKASSSQNMYSASSVNNDVTSTTSSPSSASAAWLAAAQILKNKEYPCTAQLIINSVNNKNYTESIAAPTGLFSKKIVKTTAFKSYLKNVKAGKAPAGIAFEKSDNVDLYLSVHNTDAKTRINLPGTGLTDYTVTVTDTYDFAFNKDYKSLITSCVNNGAWLCQQTGSLHNIKISISFTTK